ncbi:MAG: YbaN family protein [Cellulosilyticaceae bacterium]
MNNIRRMIYITVGLIAFAVGAIGVILPILPTTPFLLIASFCFVNGSTRFDEWFKQTKLYKKHLEQFMKERVMTLKQKIIILVFADTMIMIPFILVDNQLMRITLVIVILSKLYYFIFKIKTIPPKQKHIQTSKH